MASAGVFLTAGALTFLRHPATPYAWLAGGVIISVFIFAIAARLSQRKSESVTVDAGGITAIGPAGVRALPWGTIALLHVTRMGALELSDANRLAVVSISRRLERYDELVAMVLGHLDRSYDVRSSGARSRPLEHPRTFSSSLRPEVFQTLGVLVGTIVCAWLNPFAYVSGLLGLPATLWRLSRTPYAVTVGPVVTLQTLAWTRELAIERVMTIALAPDPHSRPCIVIQDASGEWMVIYISRLTEGPLELLDRLRRLRDTRGETPAGGAITSRFALGRGLAFVAVATAIVLLVAATPVYNGGVLRTAARYGSVRATRAALALRSPVDLKGRDDMTALYLAARHGHPDVVTLLLSRGANPASGNRDVDFTPLHVAGEKGFPEIVRMLLDSGVNPDVRNRWQQTPLWQVAWQNSPTDVEVATLLIDRGATIDAPDKDGWTPLHQAVRHGNTAVVRYLAARGADLGLANTKSGCCRPLELAISKGQAEALRALTERGVDVNPVHEDGRTPLVEAVVRGDQPTVELLLRAGARTDATDREGFDALRAAVKLGNVPMTELLLRHADPNAVSPRMALPLTIAIAEGRADMVRVLLRGSARPDAATDGYNSLQYAAYLGNTAVIEVMLDEGVNPNAASATHPPPVVLAAERGHLAVIRLLVERGADVHIQFQEWTALRAAQLRRHTAVIEYIQSLQ